MRGAWFRGDLSLLRQGVGVAVAFGFRSLEGLVSVAELLEKAVYEPRSLRRTSTGIAFTILNPPLRMGAFRSARLLWDGADLPPRTALLRTGASPDPVFFDSIDTAHPIEIPVGARTVVELRVPSVAAGRHRVRLELRSVAIPPLVWFEFSDELRPAVGDA